MTILMRAIIAFLILHSTFALANEPTLIKMLGEEKKTRISIAELESYSSIDFLESDSGIIIYNKKADEWRQFHHISSYEDFGRIKYLEPYADALLIACDSGVIVKAKNQKELALKKKNIIKATYLNKNVVLFCFNLAYFSPLPFLKGNGFPMNESYLISYNLAGALLDSVKINFGKNNNLTTSEINRIVFCDNKFWFLAFGFCFDCVNYGTVKGVDLKGEVINPPFENDIYIQGVLALKDTLLVVTDSTVYKYKDGKVFKTKFSYSNAGNGYSLSSGSPLRTFQLFKDSALIIPNSNRNGQRYAVVLNFKTECFDTLKFDPNIERWGEATDIKLYGGKYFMYSQELNMVLSFAGKTFERLKVYYANDSPFDIGFTSSNYISFIAADDTEIWLISSKGVYRYNKMAKKWRAYSSFLDYKLNPQKDSGREDLKSVPISFRDLSINKEYVFFSLSTHQIKEEFLVFDRKKEVFGFYTRDMFIAKYLIKKIDTLLDDGGKEDFNYELCQKETWALTNFFYQSDCNQNSLINKDDYTLFWFKTNKKAALAKLDKATNKISIYTPAQKTGKTSFYHYPYLISGNDSCIWIYNSFNSENGIFKYLIKEDTLISYHNWKNETEQSFIALENENKIIFQNTRIEKISYLDLEKKEFYPCVIGGLVFSTREYFLVFNRELLYFFKNCDEVSVLNKQVKQILTNGAHVYMIAADGLYEIK